MSPELKQILMMLPHLSADELAVVKSRVALNRDLGNKKQAGDDSDWLYEGIVSELKRRGVLSVSARPPLRSLGHAAPEYNRQAQGVRAALLAGLRYKPRPPDLLSLGRLAARSLADDLQGGPAPICLQVMVQNVQRTVGAVDKDYPGYVGCGLLGFILRQKETEHGPMGTEEEIQE